jgi:hypothetical protein
MTKVAAIDGKMLFVESRAGVAAPKAPAAPWGFHEFPRRRRATLKLVFGVASSTSLRSAEKSVRHRLRF